MTTAQNTSLLLRIEIFDYWIAGSGMAENSALDECVEKDVDGLPYLPGKHIKGLMRDAMRCAEAWEWPSVASGSTVTLFGTSALETTHLTPDDTDPGLLHIYDARLPETTRAELVKRPELCQALFGEAYSTAIGTSGTALEKSLRGAQTTIPLILEAPILSSIRPLEDAQKTGLMEALRLIWAVGKKRHRGMGRARLTLEENDHVPSSDEEGAT